MPRHRQPTDQGPEGICTTTVGQLQTNLKRFEKIIEMKTKIAVTSVSPLVGRHKYKPSRELFLKIARKDAGFKDNKNKTFSKIEESLRKLHFVHGSVMQWW